MIEFCRAQHSDIDPIVNLVNKTYRGEDSRLGWTTEADLLEGLRTNYAHISGLLQQSNTQILLAKQEKAVIGSILLEYSPPLASVELGMFAVLPAQQNQGIGKQLLAFAELTAIEDWHPAKLLLEVIPCRQELIAFYQRRGYQFNGSSQPFPVNPELWRPKRSGLTLAYMEKLV